MSSANRASIEVDDPWVDDQITTKYTRIKAPPAEPAADDLPAASHTSKPPWWRVLTVCSAVAACLVLGQMLWATRALPADAPATLAKPTNTVDIIAAGQPESASAAVPTPTPTASSGADSVDAAGREASAPVDARKRRDKTARASTRLRRSTAAVSGKQQDGLPATLNIDSEPWSEITIDNSPMGRTPQRGISLKPGKRKVLLRNPESDVTKILILHVLPGESIERVERLVQ
jgi:hypothetical protein